MLLFCLFSVDNVLVRLYNVSMINENTSEGNKKMSNPYAASNWTRNQIQKQNLIEDIARTMMMEGRSRQDIKDFCDKLYKQSFYKIVQAKENLKPFRGE